MVTTMNINQIKSFLAVSQSLNFTKAARQNGVPQSSISRQINDLENHLGVKLFYRTKRDVRLTKEGQVFLPYAHDILNSAKKGYYAVQHLHNGTEGRLSIAAITTSYVFLAKCLKEFAQRYPNINLDLAHLYSSEPIISSESDPYDFHFIYSNMIPDVEEYDSLEIYTDPLCFVVPKGHKFVGDTLNIETLQHEKFILISEKNNPLLNTHVMNFCRSRRFSPNVINQFDDFKSVLLSISAGLGISIMPMRLVSETLPSHLDVIPIEDEAYAIKSAAVWKKSMINPATPLFLEIIKNNI